MSSLYVIRGGQRIPFGSALGIRTVATVVFEWFAQTTSWSIDAGINISVFGGVATQFQTTGYSLDMSDFDPIQVYDASGGSEGFYILNVEGFRLNASSTDPIPAYLASGFDYQIAVSDGIGGFEYTNVFSVVEDIEDPGIV